MIKERIIQILEYKNIPKESFYKDIGMTSANFRGKAKETPLNSNAIENILSIIPDINPTWLLTGKGKMLKGKGHELSIISGQEVPYIQARSEDLIDIPIIDIEAAAGSGQLNGDYIEPLGHITVPANSLHSRTATYYAIRSRGDSMFPTIYDKDVLIIRQLERAEWADIRDEYVYVVVDSEGKTYVKRIRNRLSRGFIVLTSDNLDKHNYPNFTLEESELHYFFYAELKISAHFPNINATYFDRLKLLEDRFDEVERQLKRLQ
ncbi:Putative Hypothetical protein [Petrimonas sp. IBARAKI]|nr:Putative Hypothetical protein [Petrimonas sp. IBARAKI]